MGTVPFWAMPLEPAWLRHKIAIAQKGTVPNRANLLEIIKIYEEVVMNPFTHRLFDYDQRLFRSINQGLHCKAMNILMLRITHLGGTTGSIALPLSLLLLSQNRALGIFMAKSLIITTLISLFIKAAVNRPRPCIALENIKNFNLPLYTYSFPSGHTTAAFTTATALSIFLPAFTMGFFFLAFLVGISRIYLGVHYPTDVICGSLLGFTSTLLLHLFGTAM